MLRSMTAFATRTGAHGATDWLWEMRGVNGKGLDLRLRLPEGIEGLEAALRAAATARLVRGNVTVSLRLRAQEGASALRLDGGALDVALAALAETEARADARGLTLAPSSAAQVLALRGLLDPGEEAADPTTLGPLLIADFEALLESFVAMRAEEGAALATVLAGQLDRIASLTEEAEAGLATRAEAIAESHRAALGRLADAVPEIAPERIAQELALLAVRLDVTEELDRLRAHLGAARALLDHGSPVGRKLDFLSQEFMREANTLCSKAQHAGLSAIGLEMKTVIDQIREQVQNVE